jgi:DNA-binding MarR family transcriptional regulator
MARRAQTDPPDPTDEFPFAPGAYFLHLSVVLDRHRDVRIEKMLRPFRVSLAGHRVMWIIDYLGAVTMGEIADYAIIDRTTLTRVVDRLVEVGFVARSTPPGDRRKIVLALTLKGKQTHAAMRRRLSRDNQALTEGLPERDLRIAARLQQRIVQRLIDNERLARRLLWIDAAT